MDRRDVLFIRDTHVSYAAEPTAVKGIPSKYLLEIYPTEKWPLLYENNPLGCLYDVKRGDIICVLGDRSSRTGENEMESEVIHVCLALDRLQEHDDDGKITYIHPEQYDAADVDDQGSPFWWHGEPSIKTVSLCGGDDSGSIGEPFSVVPHPALWARGHPDVPQYKYVVGVPFSEIHEKTQALLRLVFLSNKALISAVDALEVLDED